MDNEYELDLDAILETVRTADVLAFRFVTVSERLLIDNRFTEMDAPMVKLVPRASSAKERFKSLKMLRPRFRLPRQDHRDLVAALRRRAGGPRRVGGDRATDHRQRLPIGRAGVRWPTG